MGVCGFGPDRVSPSNRTAAETVALAATRAVTAASRWLPVVGGMVAGALVAMAPLPAGAQTTLGAIKARGEVRCGVSEESLAGFSMKDERSVWRGFDVAFCRALAAAIFDDPAKVAFTPLSQDNRFAALVSGSIDVLARNTTWTLAREAGRGIQFPR